MCSLGCFLRFFLRHTVFFYKNMLPTSDWIRNKVFLMTFLKAFLRVFLKILRPFLKVFNFESSKKCLFFQRIKKNRRIRNVKCIPWVRSLGRSLGCCLERSLMKKTVDVPMNSKVGGTNSYVIKKSEYVVYFFMKKKEEKVN